MKTTIDLAPALLEEARRVARRERTTIRELVEAGLRHELARRAEAPSYVFEDARVHGRGLQPEFDGAPWEKIREAVLEGRGG